MKKSRVFVIAGGCLLSTGVFAGKAPPPVLPGPATTTTTTTPNQSNRNTVYGGLKWDLPGPLAPSLVLGVRHAKIQSDNDVFGFDVSMGVALFGGIKPGKLRLKAFGGNRDVQAELGGGFDFARGAFFAGPSVNAPFAQLGVDWVLGSGLQPYGMIHTFGKPHKVQPITTTTTTAAPVVPPVVPPVVLPPVLPPIGS